MREKLENRDQTLSLDELFDHWRAEYPSDAQYAEDIAAVNAAIEDFKNGDRGRLAGELSGELRGGFEMSDK